MSDHDVDQTLTLRHAFDVLREVLGQFNARGAQETGLLASWLELLPDGGMADPAQLHDVLESARAVLARRA